MENTGKGKEKNSELDRDSLLENSKEYRESAAERNKDELEYHRNRTNEIENEIKELF